MKRTWVILGGVAVLTAAYLGNQLWAQQGQSVVTTAPASTRIAFVNIEIVLEKYTKAMVYKKEMDTLLEPARQEAEKLKREYLAWKSDLASGKVPADQRERYEAAILGHERKLQDLQREVGKKYQQHSEKQIVQLYKEVNEAVEAHARAHGFHAVFCYGESTKLDPLSVENIVRKIRGIESTGCAMPIYLAPGLDISEAVAGALNQRYASAGAASGVTPASGTLPGGNNGR